MISRLSKVSCFSVGLPGPDQAFLVIGGHLSLNNLPRGWASGLKQFWQKLPEILPCLIIHTETSTWIIISGPLKCE